MHRLKQIIAILVLTLVSMPAHAQIRVLSYNIAQFNGDANAMASVLTEASLDDSHGFAVPVSIFLFQEVEEDELPILQKVVGPKYTMGTFTDQNDSSWGGAQAMFYLSTQFVEDIASHQDIYTYASRHADRWGLDVNGYEERLYVYSMHLKASTGSANQELRRAGAENVRDDIMLLPDSSKIIVVGDMNFYTPTEPGYQWFIEAGDGQIVDPLGNGAWSSGTHALKHTQSPLQTQSGGLIGGGMDDRFDFQFVSPSMIDGGGFDLIGGTYRGFGNDGQHYNDSINSGNNYYYPGDVARGNALADLLFIASDHIPVIADYMIPAKMAWDIASGDRVLVDAVTSVDISIDNVAPVIVSQGADALHADVVVDGDLVANESLSVLALQPQLLSIPIDTSNAYDWSATLTITSTSVDTDQTPIVSNIEGSVIEHANPSFSYFEDIDWYTHQEAFEAGTGVQTFTVLFFNYGYSGSQSLLEIDNVALPDSPLVFNGLSTDTVGQIPAQILFEIDTDGLNEGIYSFNAPLSISDEDLPGELSDISMLAIQIEITSDSSCLADLVGGQDGGDGIVDVNDLLALIGDWGLSDSPADITGAGGNPDGIVDIADLLELIAQWGPCE